MIFLEPITDLDNEENKKNMAHFKQHVASGKPTFLFMYMDGCGPCDETQLAWVDIPLHIKKENLSNKNVMVAQINRKLFNSMHNIGVSPLGFPSLRFINKNGKIIEEYDSGRKPEDFAHWIQSKLPHHKIQHYYHRAKTMKHKSRKAHKSHRNYKKNIMGGGLIRGGLIRGGLIRGGLIRGGLIRGGKWSLKYKKSINCNRPKGFSQRQHCKYGRTRRR
jgi:thiol-disulfide isomerase/thioredoxin